MVKFNHINLLLFILIVFIGTALGFIMKLVMVIGKNLIGILNLLALMFGGYFSSLKTWKIALCCPLDGCFQVLISILLLVYPV